MVEHHSSHVSLAKRGHGETCRRLVSSRHCPEHDQFGRATRILSGSSSIQKVEAVPIRRDRE
jgi:hypothetical protein